MKQEHAKYLRIKNSKNPEDYYIWTKELSTNDELEPYDGALPPRIPRENANAREVINPAPPPVSESPIIAQIQGMIGDAAKIPESESTPVKGVNVPTVSRIDAIKAIIPTLDPVKDWAKPGPVNGNVSTPRVSTVSEKLGFKVTLAEIKEAMKGE